MYRPISKRAKQLNDGNATQRAPLNNTVKHRDPTQRKPRQTAYTRKATYSNARQNLAD